MHKMHKDARTNTSATLDTHPAHLSDWRRVLGAAGKQVAGRQGIEAQNIVRAAPQVPQTRHSPTAKAHASREASMAYTHTQLLSL